jgi:hypothetical protein
LEAWVAACRAPDQDDLCTAWPTWMIGARSRYASVLVLPIGCSPGYLPVVAAAVGDL